MCSLSMFRVEGGALVEVNGVSSVGGKESNLGTMTRNTVTLEEVRQLMTRNTVTLEEVRMLGSYLCHPTFNHPV